MENHFSLGSQIVKFSKAYDRYKNIVDILDIKNNSITKKQEFQCIGCGEVLNARTGKIRAAHFYHQLKPCSFETYLHKLGKQIFYKEFLKRKNDHQSFILGLAEKKTCRKFQSFGKTCSTRCPDTHRINLIDEYPEIAVEKKAGNFIPDLKIFNPNTNEMVFIEIVVTNAPSIEKINSGIPIIQINAFDEYAFQFLSQGFISESISQVQLHNFRETNANTNECTDQCQIKHSDKAYFQTMTWIKESFDHHKKNQLPFYIEFSRPYSCSRFLDNFETVCNYSETNPTNIISIYESIEFMIEQGTVFLKFKHTSNQTKDILIVGNKYLTPRSWKGAVIRLNEIAISNRTKSKYLDRLSNETGFHLDSNAKPAQSKNCGATCKEVHRFFCVKIDMGAIMLDMTLSDSRLHDGTFPYIRLLDPSMLNENKEKLFHQMVAESLKEGISIKNCYVCRYHALNKRTEINKGPIFCKTYKKACLSNDAAKCDRYKADLNSVAVNFLGRLPSYNQRFRSNDGWNW